MRKVARLIDLASQCLDYHRYLFDNADLLGQSGGQERQRKPRIRSGTNKSNKGVNFSNN